MEYMTLSFFLNFYIFKSSSASFGTHNGHYTCTHTSASVYIFSKMMLPDLYGPAGGIVSVSPQSCDAVAGGPAGPACSEGAEPTAFCSTAGDAVTWSESSRWPNDLSSPEEMEREQEHCL